VKLAISTVFATSLTLMSSAANSASIADFVLAVRSQLNPHHCGDVSSCKKHRAATKKPYETASARSTMVNENSLPSAAQPGSPIGRWIVDDDDRRVQIMPCGKSLCGVIIAAKPDAVDRFNPDPDRRGRTIVNLPVLIKMRQTETNRWEGQIYNTKDGRTYFGTISLRRGNLLEVEGNAPQALLVQTWIKDTTSSD
jgi:uncharacterized protein (DUF2147 family)